MSAYRVAVNKLSRRSYLSQEMQQVLEEKGFPAEEIEETMQKLHSLGFLNDKEWVEQAIRREIRSGHGPVWIFQKLKFKGAPQELIEECLPVAYPEEMRLETIRTLKSKLKSKEKNKLIASIARRGFHISEILKVCYNKECIGSEVCDEY